MTGGWDTVQLPISANNYFAIASPATPTTDYWQRLQRIIGVAAQTSLYQYNRLKQIR